MIFLKVLQSNAVHIIKRGLSLKVDQSRLGVIGVPFWRGQPNPGVDLGPKQLREEGKIISVLREQTDLIDVKDYGDISYEPISFNKSGGKMQNLKNIEHVAGVSKALSDKVFEVLNDGRVCLTLGGDHSIGVGTLDGHLRYDPNAVVFWIDAHADINTPETSSTGNVHGMPLSIVMKELHDAWSKIEEITSWLKPRLFAKDLVYIGLRDVDEGEKNFINQLGIQAYGMKEVDRYGVKTIVEMALDRVDPLGNRKYHCSYDIDSLDIREAPSTGTTVRGGLHLREGIQIVEKLHATGRLEALDLVEVNPKIGGDHDVSDTVRAAVAVISSGVGGNRYAY